MRLIGVSAALLLASLPSTFAQHVAFHPLSCNANLTVADCDGGSELTLSSILADHLSSVNLAESSSNTTTTPSRAVIPCGVCAVADLTLETPTLSAPHGIDVQGMLYVPSTSVGTLEAAHVIIQGTLKIDPHSDTFQIKLTGDGSNVLLTPHEENLSACEMNLDGKCNLGKRPIAVVGGTLDVKGVEDTSETCPAWVKLRDVTSPNFTTLKRIQGEEVDETVGNVVINGGGISYYDPGDSLLYHNVDFGSSSTVQAKSIKFRYTKGNAAGHVKAYADGVLIGTIYPPTTGDWSVHKEAVFPFDILQEGNHTLRLDAHGSPGVMGIDYFELTTEIPESILHVGPEAASCWDSWGTSSLLLTPSSTRGGAHLAKTLTIKSIDVMGTITVAAFEASLGDPSTWENGLPELSAEVASLNRPVKFDSVEDENDMHGGHLIVFHTPNVAQKLEGVEINHFGQQGILGRYPIHFHFSSEVAGSVVRKNVVRNSNQRCIVIHVTNSVLVENNVAFNTFGHCFITENGGEINNTFKDNLGSHTKMQSMGIGASDRDCSTFWVTSPRNHFIGNVAAGSERSGFWFELLRGTTSSYPVSTFTNNTSHNNGRDGFKMYPKGYQPTSLTYFDGLVAHSNLDFGMFIKRSRNFRIRNAIFANNNDGAISYQNNNVHGEVQDSAFFARLSRHADTHCNSAPGVKFSLEGAWSQIRIKNSNFQGYGNVPPGCNTPGQALQLENIQGKAATSNYAMPVLEGNTFTSNDPEWAFQIGPDQFGANFRIFLEDSDGAMNPGGTPGFFVHDKPLNTVFLPPCSEVGGKFAGNSELLFCAGACLRRVSFNDLSATDSQMVITSRTNTTKTYTYSQGSFDLTVPYDEYDVSFKDPITGEDEYYSTNLAFSAAPACTGYVTESSFIIAQPPPGYFPLYKRFNTSDVAAFSNVELSTNSIGYIDDGDWWSYYNVYFGQQEGDTTRIRLRFSKGNIGGTLQVRLGDKNGDIIATFDPYPTGGFGEFTEATFDINANVSGLHQVTFVAVGISHGLMGLQWWELAPSPPPSSSPTLAPSKSPIKTPTSSPVDSSAVWTRKDAGDISAQRGVVVDGNNNIGYFDQGDWFTYDNVYFGESPGQVGQIKLRFSKGNVPGRLEIRLGNENGQVIGNFAPYFTGSWGSFKEATFAIDAGSIEGYNQVTFRGWDTNGVLGLDWWELAPMVKSSDYTLYERKEAEAAVTAYRVNFYGTALGNFDRGDFAGYENIWFGEVGDVSKITVRYAKGNNGGRIEARLDGRYGQVLGSFYPSNTGGWGNYVEATFDISSSVSGLHMLYFVGCDLRAGIWGFDYFQLAA